jgi:hypothetical protein
VVETVEYGLRSEAMGSFPHNWDEDARRGIQTFVESLTSDAETYPDEAAEVEEMGVWITYRPDKLFPPTGTLGCWEICTLSAWSRNEPQCRWRQDEDEAAELFRQCISENIYNGFADNVDTIAFVDKLRLTGMTNT